MPQDNCQKIKLLKLMELLRQDTDEFHPMSTGEICRRLGAIGISCERRTVGKDIKVLREQGFEIMSELCGHENAYWIADRSFNVPELKILIDAVQAASFIPAGKTEELIGKIAALGGSHEAEILKENVVCFNTRKHSNGEIFYNVEALEAAVRTGKKASFFYFDLDEKGRRVYRKNASRYIVDPMALVFSEDNYYLMCYSAKYKGITTYRLDRMDHVSTEKEDSDEAAVLNGETWGEYTKQVFRMYNGTLKKVTLEFSDSLIGAVYDKFGEDVKIRRTGDKTCTVSVKVQISPAFWGWLFQMSCDMRIVSPRNVAAEFEKRLSDALIAMDREE